MKQLVHSTRGGRAAIWDVPAPWPRPGEVLVHTHASLLSAGTERTFLDFAQKSLLAKARSRPDLVRQVVEKARREGAVTALEAAFNRLDEPVSLGYSSAGIVVGVGEGVAGFQPGDRVACAGGGKAVHAEIVSVPVNLVARIPSAETSFDEAAFTTLGAIALHGVRLADVKLGECAAVIGLGLIGLLAVQELKAAGCRVVAFDPQPRRAGLAQQLGADRAASDPEAALAACHELSPAGADSILITAHATDDAPIQLAGRLARDRAVVVAVGSVGMTVPRKLFYEKELDFRISRSYGPGRYDPAYEEAGHDYPIGYVRWTENRNMVAFLQLLAERKVQAAPLITHRIAIEEAERAYRLVMGEAGEEFLGVLIHYPGRPDISRRVAVAGQVPEASTTPAPGGAVGLGLLGAGNFARVVLLPVFRRLNDVKLVAVCSAGGLSARYCAGKFGFQYCTTEETQVLNDPGIQAVFIATRHHLHARQAIAALRAGKHVFVEKPLALSHAEVEAVREAYENSGRILMVGFNRRFAPLACKLRAFFADVREPLLIHYRVNAGYIPPDHWTQDPAQGGGRIIGEVCHFIDAAGWLAGERPVSVQAVQLPDSGRYRSDNVAITISYPNGTVAVITYLANGDRALGKERIEVHGGGRSAVLEDFRSLQLVWQGRHRTERSLLRQDKGHQAEVAEFCRAARAGAPSPIPFADLLASSEAAILAAETLAGAGGDAFGATSPP